MIIKEVVQIGNPLLRQKCKMVRNCNTKKVKKIIRDLADTMRYNDLVGMAASQIGYKLKIFITEVRKTPSRTPEEIDKLRVYINSRITWKSKKEVVIYEACGSVAHADFYAPVKRPQKVIVRALDENSERFELKADGLLARVIQHEYDHHHGIEFIDKITDMRKAMSEDEYIKKFVKN